MTPTAYANAYLADCVTAIRNGRISYTGEKHRTKTVATIANLTEMLPQGEPLGPMQLMNIANAILMAYAVGRLDGMRDMMDEHTTDTETKG